MKVSELSMAIGNELMKFSEEYANKLKSATKEVAEECVEELKRTSPRSKRKSKKRYADGWEMKKQYESSTGIRYKIKNKNKPQLSHLLEFGHALGNGGRADAKPHIKPAERNAKEKLIKKIKEN